MENIIGKEIDGVVNAILSSYDTDRYIDRIDIFKRPDKNEIIEITRDLLKVVYPGYYWDKAYKIYNINTKLSMTVEDVMYHLNKQIALALAYSGQEHDEETIQTRSQQIAVAFFKKVPEVRDILETDLEAAFDGDPAAKYHEEIIMSYPGLYAITVYRLAHELFLLNVPLIPRIMTEYAHTRTGIDIHPGATIGKYFFIDHGTGIVVGETSIIGEHVKIYQGVTIGALSTRGGQKLQSVKRHPTIEDNVTIYAGASILGGKTVIGENSVIGSNAFITSSVEKETKVSIKNQELNFHNGTPRESVPVELKQSEDWYYII
ncbi:MAG: serine acetyltransferase [Lachnospiraceae bacterium]|nr:serine acetyltransferase [Lachnospiraceae bacterium]